MRTERADDPVVDIVLADSFPASDPPYFMAAAAVVGGPRSRARPKPRDRITARNEASRRKGALND